MQSLTKQIARMSLAGVALPLLLQGGLAQAQSNLGNGLVAYWAFEDNYLDSYGANHGEARGAAPIPFVAGKAGFGQAIKLNGNDQFVEITGGNEDDLEFPGGSMSIAGWFKVDAFDTDWQALIAKGEGSNWRVARRSAEGGIAYAGGATDTPSGTDVNDGQWHHFVAISDATAANWGTAMYIDGVLDTQIPDAPVLASNSMNVMIGENPDARGREFEGELDDIGIWNRVLTEDEISALYAGGTGAPIRTLVTAKVDILGIGTTALLGRDLTDPEDDGVETPEPDGANWNWVSIESSNEPGFGGGEFAYNVFDNRVGGGNDKWCCDPDPTIDQPLWIAVEFADPVSLTRFTVTSGNDSPDRDPTDWAIQGSNDGVTYEDIYHFTGTPALWTDRNQVLRFSLLEPAAPYKFIRYIAWETPGTLHQINEIEYFTGSVAYISAVNGGMRTFTFSTNDEGASIVDPATATLTVDDAPAALTFTKDGAIASFTHTYATPLTPGTEHSYTITVQDTDGQTISQTSTFTLPLPIFPTEDLKAPAIVDKAWAQRYIFGQGTIGSLDAAFAAIAAVGTADFVGEYVDVTAEVVNHPESGGFMGNGLPYPDEVINSASGLWTQEDFIQLSVGHLEITEAGEYTFGFHSDDGFAFRIRGGEAISVSGNGQLDPVDPEAVLHPNTTGDSNTRGVYYLNKGVYRVEYFWYERGGGDHGELYAAKGAYVNDADTDQWTLVGSNASSQTFNKLGLDANGVNVVSSDPGGDLQLQFISDAEIDLAETGGAPVRYDVLNIGDPDSNAGVEPFPKDTAGVAEDDFAMRITGNVVVPVTGLYEVGFYADDGAWMKMPGQNFTEIAQDGSGVAFIDGNDTVYRDITGSTVTSVRVNLTAGTHPVEFGMFERSGGAFIRGFGVTSGATLYPTLVTNGAGSFETPEPLHLTNKPTGVETPAAIGIARDGGNVVLTFEGTLESADAVTGPWSAVAGANSPATIPATGAAKYYRTRN